MIEAPARGVLAGLRAAIDEVLGVDVDALAPLELTELIAGLEVERRRLAAVDVLLINALAAQATPAQFGATSVPDLVGALTRTSRGVARARVQRSQDLAPRRTLSGEALAPIHPLAAEALSAGEISPEHVDVITRYLGRLPASCSLEVFAAAEAFLVEAAKHEDPALLRRSGELLLARLDPDGQKPRDEQAERERCFGIGGRGGANGIYGQFTDEAKAVVQAMLDSLAAPQPGPDGEPDPRSAGQRNHDALLEALLRLLGSDTLPAAGGTPAKVVVHVTADDLDKAAKGETSGVARTGHGDVVSLERFLRLADQADITTVVLTVTSPQRLSAPLVAPPITLPLHDDKFGWTGRCAGTKPDRPKQRPVHPNSAGSPHPPGQPVPAVRVSPPDLRIRRVGGDHARRRPAMDPTRLAGPVAKTQTQHRPPPTEDHLRQVTGAAVR